MSHHVCNLAQTKCSMGLVPSVLMVTPEKMVITSFMPAANIMDNVPMKNVMPFGTCKSPANPATAALTAAALGVLTPGPCIPVIPGPWMPGAPTVLLKNQPSLNKSSKLMCAYGGVIEITNEGQKTHEIPG